jgi:hypothetical protein
VLDFAIKPIVKAVHPGAPRERSIMIRLCIVSAILLFSSVPFYADIPFDFDKEYRQEFKGIMIHHTGTTSDYPGIKFLSDIQKNTVYKPVFDGMGVKIYSNHFYNGQETFFCYHWLVYPDGKKVKVLKDIFKADGKWYIDYMAWNAGSWEVNGQTVAICLAGNYMNRVPTKEALETVAGIIADYRKTTGIDLFVKGHREVKATECPGNKFPGPNGWKKTLLKMVEDRVEAQQAADAE